MIGFSGLSDQRLTDVIQVYRDALEQHAQGKINYPCGSRPCTVRRWLASAEAELQRR